MRRKKAPNGRVLANAVTTSKTPDKARKSSCRTVFGDDWNQPPDWEIPDWEIPGWEFPDWEIPGWEIEEWKGPADVGEWDIPDFREGVEWPTPD